MSDPHDTEPTELAPATDEDAWVEAVRPRLATVRDRIASACEQAGRSPSSVQLIGVTKTHPPVAARAAVRLGLVDLGENRVQELLGKVDEVPGARWHVIGRLQRNKVKYLVGRGMLIHSVDRRSLARSLSDRAADANVVQRVLVQVNVGDDPAKGGVEVSEALELVAYARDLPHLAVEGLMTIPPMPDDDADPAEASRPHFATLRALRDEARSHWPEIVHLSMGMTADLEAAVAEGATMVRIGTALFGPRVRTTWRP